MSWLEQEVLLSIKNLLIACLPQELKPLKSEIFHFFGHKHDAGMGHYYFGWPRRAEDSSKIDVWGPNDHHCHMYFNYLGVDKRPNKTTTTTTTKCRRFIVHYASLTCNSTRLQHITAAYIWHNYNSLSNSHPHRICNFRTLSSGSDSNADNQYSQLKRFIVRDLTDWANENHLSMVCGPDLALGPPFEVKLKKID